MLCDPSFYYGYSWGGGDTLVVSCKDSTKLKIMSYDGENGVDARIVDYGSYNSEINAYNTIDIYGWNDAWLSNIVVLDESSGRSKTYDTNRFMSIIKDAETAFSYIGSVSSIGVMYDDDYKVLNELKITGSN